MTIIQRPSPNYRVRRSIDGRITAIVIHDTASPDLQSALSWLTHPASDVSSHYLIDVDGTIYQLVEEEMCAWHAGISILHGVENVNDYSIGIELVGTGDKKYPEIQTRACAALCADICQRRVIALNRVVGHKYPGR